MSASEVLSEHAAAEMRAAWESAPFAVYAATETAGIASPCVFHNSHIHEDLVIVEPVDQAGLPVPPGTIGARILVTVLFSRTLPLIRYEMSDSVGIDGRGCPCGRSFALLAGIEGRVEDVLMLPGITGEVSIHPNVFHNVLDGATIAGMAGHPGASIPASPARRPGRVGIGGAGSRRRGSSPGISGSRRNRR